MFWASDNSPVSLFQRYYCPGHVILVFCRGLPWFTPVLVVEDSVLTA